MTHIAQFIPSPSQGVWHLGPLPIRAYALCIVAGIFAGYFLGRHRWIARGGKPEVIADITMWAVPFGLVGSRIYHVITDYELYFGPGKHPIDALKIDQSFVRDLGARSSSHSIVAAMVGIARSLGLDIVAEGVERVDEFRAMAELGVDLGQGFYFGQPTDKPMAVDSRLVRPSMS